MCETQWTVKELCFSPNQLFPLVVVHMLIHTNAVFHLHFGGAHTGGRMALIFTHYGVCVCVTAPV